MHRKGQAEHTCIRKHCWHPGVPHSLHQASCHLPSSSAASSLMFSEATK
uniref:Uncharacterized protein n=1 Tax=Anguilla anguilla TaxID=7936 RepID=A0A0E9WA53_ANGAN